MRTLLPILLIILSCCSRDEISQGVIPEDRFINYYADLLVVRQEGMMTGTDSIGMKSKVDSLNNAYAVSPDQVQTTLRQFKNNLPRWRTFYERVVKRLESLQLHDSTKSLKSQ